MDDFNDSLDGPLLKAPENDEEREAFLYLDPASFYIRHPPPPHKLNSFVTHDDDLFQTIHMGGAEVSLEKWILVIDGMVERAFALTLKQLQSLPSKTITSLHECYGSPLVPATKALRRIGNVQWTGVPLKVLLDEAHVLPEGRFVWSEGLDRGAFGGIEADRYMKDLPIDKAMSSEVLVAYAMNSQPLNKNRGGPVRLVVPGWFGTNSTKWLSKLTVQDRRAPGHFTTTFYNERYPADDPTCESRPIWSVQPNSMIVTPIPESEITGVRVSVEGWAWSCEPLDDVSVSADEGKTWVKAEVDERTEFSWQRFKAQLDLPPGDHVVLSRASSSDGRMQPMGEGRNHVHRVPIRVS